MYNGQEINHKKNLKAGVSARFINAEEINHKNKLKAGV
jgi:hypothetical protein